MRKCVDIRLLNNYFLWVLQITFATERRKILTSSQSLQLIIFSKTHEENRKENKFYIVRYIFRDSLKLSNVLYNIYSVEIELQYQKNIVDTSMIRGRSQFTSTLQIRPRLSNYAKRVIRTPWRIAVYFHWNSHATARAWTIGQSEISRDGNLLTIPLCPRTYRFVGDASWRTSALGSRSLFLRGRPEERRGKDSLEFPDKVNFAAGNFRIFIIPPCTNERERKIIGRSRG